MKPTEPHMNRAGVKCNIPHKDGPRRERRLKEKFLRRLFKAVKNQEKK